MQNEERGTMNDERGMMNAESPFPILLPGSLIETPPQGPIHIVPAGVFEYPRVRIVD